MERKPVSRRTWEKKRNEALKNHKITYERPRLKKESDARSN